MKELETKKIIAEEILNRMNDQGAADVLRDILSNNDNKIDKLSKNMLTICLASCIIKVH